MRFAKHAAVPKNAAKLPFLLDQALSLQRMGRFKEAADAYRQILLTSPKHPDALHLLGVVASNMGNLDDAIQLIAQSLSVNPHNHHALKNLATVLEKQRRFDEAIEFHQAAIALCPKDANLYCNLGNALKELGRFEEAKEAFSHAVELDPNSALAHCNLGNLFKTTGNPAEAVKSYQKAISLNPGVHQFYTNLGAALNDLGRFPEAVLFLKSALELEPESEAAHLNMGVALKGWGKVPEAINSYWHALKLNPKSFLAFNNLGNALKELGRYEEAVAYLQKALRLKPDSYLAHLNLGTALTEMGHADEALACYRQALALRPDSHNAFSNLLFTLNYLPNQDPVAVFEEHRRFGEYFGEPLAKLALPHSNTPESGRKLRVGFVSGDLREHPVAWFIEPVFANYTRSSFEIHCYANQPVNDSFSERLQEHVDSWRNVDGLSDEELAARIRADRIDILVDLSGHTARNRLLVFARKPAPVQVTMIGYMQTTGLTAMDYRITDDTLDPAGATERLNTEKLIRLAAGAAPFLPPRDCPEVNELPALKNGHITFASFNNLAKVTPEVIGTWAKLLRALPDSKLVVVGRGGNPVAGMLESHGIDKKRLTILDRKPLPEYLALHHEVDFVLDAFPYNGGTTNLIAAWMGVPFVTVEGTTTISRVGSGILQAAGLRELAASSPEDYVSKALHAVRDLEQLAGWRRTLRSRLTPWLGDGSVFTRQLEQAFRTMWKHWCVRQFDYHPRRSAAPQPTSLALT